MNTADTADVANTAATASITDLNIPGYELLCRIDSGGMGTVYLARQASLNRHVAIKVLDRFEESSAQRRFERESLLAASVTHPAIVFIVDAGTIDGVPYLVQEFIDGSSLADLLEERHLSAREVCNLLEPVADALAHVHQAGIIHRDLKPRNILIDVQGRPKLSDFGLAVCADAGSTLTQTAVIVGTLDYMAPEQRHRLDVDERADQYSLAAVAYEMLTGQKPLGAFKRPSELNLELPTDVDAVLLSALARDPDERFADVSSFFAALKDGLCRTDQRSSRYHWLALGLTAVVASLLTWAVTAYERPALEPNAPGAAQNRIATVTEPDPSTVSYSQDRAPRDTDDVELMSMTVDELIEHARSLGLTGYSGLVRSELEELIRAGGHSFELPPGWTTEIRIDSAERRFRWFISPDGRSYRSLPKSPATGTGSISDSSAVMSRSKNRLSE